MADDLTAPCASAAEMGRRFGRSDTAARKWTRSSRWPDGVPVKPPWNRRQMTRIAAFVGQLRPAAGSGAQKPTAASEADRELKQERAALIRLRRSIEEGKYIARDQVDEWREAALYVFRASLARLVRSLPVELNVPAEQQARASEVLEQRFAELCNRFADDNDPEQKDIVARRRRRR